MGVQNVNFNILGGFQRNENCFRYVYIVDILGVIAKMDYILGHFSVFRVFSSQCAEWEYFWGR